MRGLVKVGEVEDQYSEVSEVVNLYNKVPKVLFNNVVFIGVVAAYFLFVLNFPLIKHVYNIYQESKTSSGDSISILFLISALVAIGLLLNAIFLLLFSWRYVLKPGLIIITLIGAASTYATWRYGILFDKGMIRNFLQTNSHEALSYLSWSAVFSYALLGVVPALLIAFAPITYARGVLRSMALRGGVLACSLAIAGGVILTNFQQFSFIGRNNPTLNKEINPTTIVYNTFKVVKEDYFTAPPEPVSLGDDAKILTSRKDPMALIMVLGETGRAANYQYRGYGRETNEFTSALPVIGFKHVTSCGTATARSVPCMFSNLTQAKFSEELTINRDNVLDVLKKSGVDVTWMDNQSDCKGVCDKVKVVNIIADQDEMCSGGQCYDGVFLEKVRPFLQNIKQDTVIGVHIMGSHGPRYYERYPANFEKFSPACSRPDVENCSVAEVVNAYDNTIRYTDYVVAGLIKLLEDAPVKNTALLYMSDHGESLGENGLFLHGMSYAFAPSFQKEIPLQIYLSDAAKESIGLDNQCLAKRAESERFSHDNLFHTLLGIFDVQTKDYNPDLDLLRACRVISPNDANDSMQRSSIGNNLIQQQSNVMADGSDNPSDSDTLNGVEGATDIDVS